MRAISATSHHPEPYRAGLELGATLARIAPEVVLLFHSGPQQHAADLVEGLNDALDNPNLLVIGSSADGVFQARQSNEPATMALGINSEGHARWYLVSEPGLRAHPRLAVRRAWQRLAKRGLIDLVLLLSDGGSDAAQLEQALQEEIPIPVVGGVAGRWPESFVYANRELLRDSVVMLGCHGSFAFDIALAHQLPTLGLPGRITAAEGCHVTFIDDLPASDFVQAQLSQAAPGIDAADVALQVVNPAAPQEQKLRSLSSAVGVELHLHGGVSNGQWLQLSHIQPQALRQQAQTLEERAEMASFEPRLALLLSCAERQRWLGALPGPEAAVLTAQFGQQLPLLGIALANVFSPHKDQRGYSRNLLHNLSASLLLLGD